MGNMLIGAPNWVKGNATIASVVGGGLWEPTAPSSNIKSKFFKENSISVNTALTSTTFDVDCGSPRDFNLLVIPNSSISRTGKVTFKLASTIAWTNYSVLGPQNIGNNSISVNTGINSVNVGDIFTIAGDNTVYKVTSASPSVIQFVRSNTTGTGLAVALTGGEAITCHSGLFTGTSLVYNSGALNYFEIVYPAGSLPWGSAGVWDGRLTEEQISQLDVPVPLIVILPSTIVARYIRVEINDTSNPAGFVSIDGFYGTSTYEPTYNAAYGSVTGIQSNTSSERSAGGVEVFDNQKQSRFVNIELNNNTIDEIFINVYDLQRQLDISEDFYFIFDKDDTSLMLRRAFPAYFETLDTIRYPFFNRANTTLRIREKIG